MAQKIKKSELHKMLGAFESVEQGDVKNEIIINFEHGRVLQSYRSLVAAYCTDGNHMRKLYLYPDNDYSNTTNRQVVRFCRLTLPERRKALESGEAIEVVMD